MSANNQPYLNPASAIVLVAEKDCRSILGRPGKRPWDKKAKAKRLEIEEFFLPDEFQLLSNLGPELPVPKPSREVHL